jgi:hypothetical protein
MSSDPTFCVSLVQRTSSFCIGAASSFPLSLRPGVFSTFYSLPTSQSFLVKQPTQNANQVELQVHCSGYPRNYTAGYQSGVLARKGQSACLSLSSTIWPGTTCGPSETQRCVPWSGLRYFGGSSCHSPASCAGGVHAARYGGRDHRYFFSPDSWGLLAVI